MMNLLMNDTVVWGLVGVAIVLIAWMWWPKKKVTEALEEVKAAEAAAPVETVASIVAKKKVAAKKAPAKAPTKKAPTKKAPAKTTKKTAPKKAVKKGKK